MGRPTKPWYRASRKEWYCTREGITYRLGPDKKEAYSLFHKIMAGGSREVPSIPGQVYLNQLLHQYLRWVETNRSPVTAQHARQFLADIDERYHTLLVGDLRPHHMQDWLDSHLTWGQTTRNIAASIVLRVLNWSVRQGLIATNPLDGFEKPPAKSRNRMVTPEEFAIILEHSKPDFRDLLTVAYDVGARPQELTRLEARHLDPDCQRAVIPTSEAKGHRHPRAVYVPTARSVEILKRLAAAHPEGPIFRNARGNRWLPGTITKLFWKLKPLLGRNVCLYEFRHAWVTRSLKAGVDSHVVAALAGHVNSSMIDRVYSHVRADASYMLEQAKRSQ